MPKLVDYAGRFDQIREAVFEITLRDGPDAISLPAVAAELQISLSSLRRTLRSADALPRLGVQWVEIRQRRHLLDRLPREVCTSDLLRRTVDALLGLVPSTAAMADEVRVWSSLVDAHARGEEWARRARDDRDAFIDVTTRRLVSCLDLSTEDADREYERIRALLEGVETLIRHGRLAPDAGASMFRRHLTDLLGLSTVREDGDAA